MWSLYSSPPPANSNDDTERSASQNWLDASNSSSSEIHYLVASKTLLSIASADFLCSYYTIGSNRAESLQSQ